MTDTLAPHQTSPAASPELSMEAYRAALFRTQVVARLHQGQSENQPPEKTAQLIAAELTALAGALEDPAFMKATSDAYIAAQHGAVANDELRISSEVAVPAIKQILERRAADARAFAAEVVKPEYYTALANTPVPANDAPIVPSLAEVKMKETLDDLRHDNKPQVIAHLEATAKGMQMVHRALALTFVPDGLLKIPLMAALQRQNATLPNGVIDRVATGWLREREAAAAITTELTANKGAAYLAAVEESKAFYAAQPTPAPAAGFAGRITEQRSQAKPELIAL